MRINRVVFFVLLFAATFGVLGAFIWGTSVGSGQPLHQSDQRSEFYTPDSEQTIGGLRQDAGFTSAYDCQFEGDTGAGGNLDRVDAYAWSRNGSRCTVEVMADTGFGFEDLSDPDGDGLFFADADIDRVAFRFCDASGANITDDDCRVELLARGEGERHYIDE